MSGALLAAAMPGRAVYSLANIPENIGDTGEATTTYSATVRFSTDGTVDLLYTVSSDNLDVEIFCIPIGKVAGLHVRCSYVSGSHLTGGDAEDTWHALTSTRSFVMSYTSGGGPDTISGTFNFELSDDAGVTEVANVDNRIITVGEIL